MKKQYNFRFLATGLLFCFLVFQGKAQSTQSSYFMDNVGARTYLNPALRPAQGYIGFPALSNIFVDVKTNTFNLSHFVFPKNNDLLNFLHKDVSINEFLDDISDDNYLSINFDYTIFSGGWYVGKNGFMSFNIGMKGYVDSNVPKGFLELAKIGLDAEKVVEYKLANTNATGTAYAEFGLGYSHSFLNNNLTVGLRGKYLAGAANIDINTDDMYLRAGEANWEARTSAYARVSAPGIYAVYDEDGIFDKFEFDDDVKVNPIGYGLGLDIGAEYNFAHLAGNLSGLPATILERLKVSAALTDIGYIKWNGDNSVAMLAKGTGYIDSDEFTFDLNDDNNSITDHIEDELDALKEAADFRADKAHKGERTTGLRTNLNVGLEYEIIKEKISAGFLSSTRFATYQNMTEYTFSVNFQPVKWFGLTGSYSFMHSTFDTFGAAIQLSPLSIFNLFIAADYITPHVSPKYYLPTTAKGLNAQFGLSIPFGSRR